MSEPTASIPFVGRKIPESERIGSENSAANSLRSLFPGYFLPRDDELRSFIAEGMVAFDTNALFDIYRFNRQARSEFVAALKLLGERLWIPHRVAHEILERRLAVIRECAEANRSFDGEIQKLFDAISQRIRGFGNRRGLTEEQISSLQAVADRAYKEISSQASGFFDFDLTVDGAVRDDKILAELESILDGKVGPPLEDLKLEEAEGARRIAEKIPPGYADHKKDPEQAIGDYLVWRQLLIEAARRAKPVLLVTNEQKPDWVREVLGRKVGPRPELVAEMLNVAGVPFRMATVKSFLLLAQKHLGAEVSPTTVSQAQQLSVWNYYSSIVSSYFSSMRAAFDAAGWPVYESQAGPIDLVVETQLGTVNIIIVYKQTPMSEDAIRTLLARVPSVRGHVVLTSNTTMTDAAYRLLMMATGIGFVQWTPDDGSEILCRRLIDELRRISATED